MKIKKGLMVIASTLLLGAVMTGCNGNQSTSNSDSTTSNTQNTSIVENTSESTTSIPNTSDTSTSTSQTTSDTNTSISQTTSSSTATPTIPADAETINFGGKGADDGGLPDNTFVYWNDQGWVGSHVTVHQSYFFNNEAVFDYEYSTTSTTTWGFQVFYKNTLLTKGKTYILKMTLYSEDDVNVVVNGKTFNLVSGDNSIEVTYIEGVMFNDSEMASIDMQVDKSSDLRNTIKISNYSWKETLGQLPAPEGIVIADEPSDNSKVIQFSQVSGATGYIVIYYDATTGNEVAREEITKSGEKLTTTLEDGTYKVKVIAKGDNTTATDSAVSTSFAYLTIGEVGKVDPTEKTTINSGEEANLPVNTYIYWADQWWCGSYVTVHEAYLFNNEVVFDYEYAENSATNWGFQVFYKNTTLTNGKEYKLTMNINSEDDVKIVVNSKEFNLVSGDNSIEVTYTEGAVYNGSQLSSIDMQIDKSSDLRNTIKLSNIIWTAI